MNPTCYYDNFLADADDYFSYMKDTEWQSIDKVPRKEAFFSTNDVPYSFGSGEYARTYYPFPMDICVKEIGLQISNFLKLPEFELCFLNYYKDKNKWLGWHSDNESIIDQTRPIATISLGAEREIWYRSRYGSITKQLLRHGSLFIMAPGMQSTHLHQIPKHPVYCGERISLTFRGFNHGSIL